MRKVIILGSTGSIGVSTLEVISEFQELFTVEALSANTNIELLLDQIKLFSPSRVAVRDEEKGKELRKIIGDSCEVLIGEEGLKSICRDSSYDILLSALVGFSGLAPTLEAVKKGKRIALANKETLVAAGELVFNASIDSGAEIIPVDSEHSAIYQCLVGEHNSSLKKLILTASGGPFLNRSKSDLQNVTVSEALAHPNWTMGDKITIDSATMMNKGLEVIEAHWLFNVPLKKIEVIIHPQSIIHSMVEFIDGSIKAQLSLPDMKLPIQYALAYPTRLENNFGVTDFRKISQLTFIEPDFDKFRSLKLAYDALELGGTAPCILNAANEIAVDRFLKGRINFLQIAQIIEESLNKISNFSTPDLETIFECDRSTREYVNNILN